MVNIFYVFIILEDLLFGLCIFLTIIYLFLILFIRRLYHHNNLLIVNICINIIIASAFFIMQFSMTYFNIQSLYTPYSCLMVLYAYSIASITIPFSFTTFTFHRLCFIIYHTKHFFKGKLWIGICIIIH